MEEYDDSYETKFAEKTENQKIDELPLNWVYLERFR